MEEEQYDDDYPCNKCILKDYCDQWEAMFCCQLCRYNGNEHCESCDPMDI